MSNFRKRVLSTKSYTPQWDGFIEGYVKNHIRANMWKVENFMEYEDVMQEARLMFWKIKTKYGDLDRPQHFMALFKRAWLNRFCDLATLSTKTRNEVPINLEDSDFPSDDHDCDLNKLERLVTWNEGMLGIMVEQAPTEVKMVLHLFLTAPVEVLDQFSAVWKSRGRSSDFGNRHLCELLGLKEGTDVVGKCFKYFL